MAMVLMLTAIPVIPAQAASKPTISVKSMQIPVGKLTKNTEWFYHPQYTSEIGTAQKLVVKNKAKGATYSFSSSNSKVVKIDKNGGYPTGVKAGKATITCTQNLKGKKTVVGKCTVTVKKADYKMGDFTGELNLGETTLVPSYTGFIIRFRNPDAKYTYKVDKEGLTVKEVKWKEANNSAENYYPMYGKYTYLCKMNAAKAGTYTVSVKETYKKKTVTVGTFKVKVYEPSLKETEVEFPVNYEEIGLLDFVDNPGEHDYKLEVVEGQDVISFTETEYMGTVGTALKEGVAKIKVTDTTAGKELGTVDVKVFSIACESIEVDEIEAEVGEEYVDIDFELEPYDTTDACTIVSNDPSIFQVVEEDGSWYGMALKEGNTTLTVTCGGQTAEISVEVY